MAPAFLRTAATSRLPEDASNRPQTPYSSATADIRLSTTCSELENSFASSTLEGGCEVADPPLPGIIKTWRSLPVDLKYCILAKLDYLDLYRAKTQSKESKDLVESGEFHGWRGKPREGYDLITKTWMRLPPFTSLPDLDPDSFKDHSICTAGCLICANVGKAQEPLVLEHCVDALDRNVGQCRSVMTEMKVGNPELQPHPPGTRVLYGEGKPRLYNTMEDREVVYEEVPSVGFVPSVEGRLGWDHLPREIQGRILGRLRYEQIYQLKTLSKDLKDLVESKESKVTTLKEKPSLTACYFFTQNDVLQWGGFDQYTKKWRLLPPLTFLPADCKPEPDLFREFLVCAKDGLVCINFPKLANEERLIVLNPLSKNWRELPPLNHRRNPVLMHMLVDPASHSYQVIVAGSCSSEDEYTSTITEAYDSHTGKWKRMGDLPDPAFALNEYQSGVFQDGKLFCIGFVEENGQVGKGIIAYDVEEGKWSSNRMHSLSFMSCTTLQLVECNGEVYLFSERSEDGLRTEHCIDRVEWAPGDGDQKNTCQLINVVKKEIRINDWRLEIYGPEYTCVPHSDSQLYIFNAYDHTGVVYDIRDPGQSEVVQALPEQYTSKREHMLNSLYPILFTVEPRFSIEV